MKATQFIKDHGLEKARAVVEGAPSNAESFQDGYYFRTKPEFQFHNGFHPVWNLTDNDFIDARYDAFQDGWKAQQAKVEELQKQLIEQGQRFNDQSQRVKDLEHKNVELQKRVDAALELMQKPVIVGEPSSYVCERFKELEQALKGEADD